MANTQAATAARMRKKDERVARELIDRGWEVRSPEDLSKPWTPGSTQKP